MAMNDEDKWASQLLDELLEKLSKVDKITASPTEIIKNERQNISKVISNVITKEISSQEPKTSENRTSGLSLKYEKDFDTFYQPGETKDAKYEVLDEKFKEKTHFEEDNDSSQDLQKVGTCDKIPKENHKSPGERIKSHHEPAETVENETSMQVKTSNKTNIGSEKKDNLPDNSVLDESVVPMYDFWESKNKDLSADNCEDFHEDNFLQTNIADREHFQLKVDNCINSIQEINSGVLTKNFESDELLLRNPEQIEVKAHRTEFSNRHHDDKKETRDQGSHIESYYGHNDEKFTREEREYCGYAEDGNLTKSCSGLKTENMPENLNTEKYEKTGNVEMKSQGDGCIIKIKNKEIDKQVEIINKPGEDIDRETILLEKEFRDAFEESEENYEDIGSDTKTENKKRFDLKTLKKITDLAPLIEPIVFCLAMDSTTDIDSVSHPQKNNCIPHKLNCVSPRTDTSGDPIIAQRYFKIISVYRKACRVFENLLLSPSAIFIAESIDVITFVFFLSVSVFYMLYKSIKIKINNFRNNKKNLSDLLKRENQMEGGSRWKPDGSSNAHCFLATDFRKEIERNNELKEKHSILSFPSHEEEKESVENKNETKMKPENVNHEEERETLENRNFIDVAPEQVDVLNYVCEYANQSLEDLYKKGSEYLENLCNEQAKAIVKSHEDIFVNIILKGSEVQSSEGDQMKANDVNVCTTDLDQDVSKSSNVICQSYENSSWKFITLSNDTQGISDDISGSKYSSDATVADNNESHLIEFPILFDKSRANIFNSTEIDNSICETRACKTLSPSEINIFDGLCSSCRFSGSICGNGLRSSSMSVNATSFPSISSINTGSRSCSSSRSSCNMEKVDPSFQGGSFHIDPIRMGQDSDILSMTNEKIADSLKNLIQSDDVFFHTEPKSPGNSTNCIQPGEPRVKDTEESYGLETPESLSVNAGSTSRYSDISDQISAVDDNEEQTIHARCENSVIYDSPQTSSYSVSLDNTYDEICFMDSDETAVSDTRVLKQKNSRKLRRRMTGIFNNLREANLMQCIMSSAKRQKKYKKQTNGFDA